MSGNRSVIDVHLDLLAEQGSDAIERAEMARGTAERLSAAGVQRVRRIRPAATPRMPTRD